MVDQRCCVDLLAALAVWMIFGLAKVSFEIIYVLAIFSRVLKQTPSKSKFAGPFVIVLFFGCLWHCLFIFGWVLWQVLQILKQFWISRFTSGFKRVPCLASELTFKTCLVWAWLINSFAFEHLNASQRVHPARNWHCTKENREVPSLPCLCDLVWVWFFFQQHCLQEIRCMH